MGMRYTMYRIRHEWERKSGALKKRHPVNPPTHTFIKLSDWRASKIDFAIDEKLGLSFEKKPSQELEEKAKKILAGNIPFFSKEWRNIGVQYDWITNPDSGYKYDISKHWSEIPDLSEQAGDIKFVWEKSRFSFIHTLIRYDYHFENDLSEIVFSEIDSWIGANPINQGPNWRCSQEISLRIFNWMFALSYYKNSAALTEERWDKIQNVIYWSLHHVYHHIDFSRIAVRNNHAITETLFLTLSIFLFPFIPETKKWSVDGKKWFEEEIDYQIYDDGTFLQFSMNYHRVVIQLLSLGITVYEKNKQSFSSLVYEKAYKSLNFLYQCMQDENGWLPNYGSNDGALFFAWTETDYRDYRPQLNSLHYTLTGQFIFEDDNILEDSNWMGKTSLGKLMEPIVKQTGAQSFDIGGVYLCRRGAFLTFIRCGNHKDRPAQADNLHIDIWCGGNNILRDSGTYKYNTDKDKVTYFTGTASHNSVMVGEHSQMLKGGRFIWYYWSQKIKAKWRETDEAYVFEGAISAFQFLNKNAEHHRTIVISKKTNEWIVKDSIENLEDITCNQIWHPNSSNLKIVSEVNAKEIPSFNSNYYGVYTDEQSLYFEFKKSIETKLTYQ